MDVQSSCSEVLRCCMSKKALQQGSNDSDVFLFGSSLRDDSSLEYCRFPSEMLLALALPFLRVFLWFPFVFRKAGSSCCLLSAIALVGQKRSRAINPSYPKQAACLHDQYQTLLKLSANSFFSFSLLCLFITQLVVMSQFPPFALNQKAQQTF